jgi:hypothetical protein
MKILFRFMISDDEGWIGYTEGRTWEEIFYFIDEFGNPYSADIIRLPPDAPIGVCVPMVYDDDLGWMVGDNDDADLEISEYFWDGVPDLGDSRWDAETKAQLAWKDYLKNRTGEVYGN